MVEEHGGDVKKITNKKKRNGYGKKKSKDNRLFLRTGRKENAIID